jgi:type I restriction enzyme, S subunit
MSNWEIKKLGEITSWFSCGTPKKDEPAYWNGDIPWISANSMDGTRYYLPFAYFQGGSEESPQSLV